MAKFKFHLSVDRFGANIEKIVEIPDEELKDMSGKERYDYIYNKYFKEWVNENVDMWFHEETE